MNVSVTYLFMATKLDKKQFNERTVYPGLKFEGRHSTGVERGGGRNRRLTHHCSQETVQACAQFAFSSS